jgi:hypothetical protein
VQACPVRASLGDEIAVPRPRGSCNEQFRDTRGARLAERLTHSLRAFRQEQP